MENKFSKFLQENNIYFFAKKRIEAEYICRNEIRLHNFNFEDCTLDEIYGVFVKIYGLDPSLQSVLREMEESTDLELCSTRSYLKELYDLAGELGKKRIIITDTYYSRNFIERLLKKLEICDYSHLFISSEVRKLKASGKLFQFAVKELKVNASKILHMGDNWNSDCLKSKECGMESYFIGKTSEIFQNIHSNDNYTGDIYPAKMAGITSFSNIKKTMEQLPIDAYHSIVANHIFDRPYPSWNRELRYNANFYFIGNYLLGGEMLGIASQLIKICQDNHYDKIVFLARDGYFPKIAFDILKKHKNWSVDTEYFYVSRRAVMPFLIESAKSVGIVQECMDVMKHSPRSILEMIKDFLVNIEQIDMELEKKNISPEETFANFENFESFVKVINGHFDFKQLSEYNASIQSKIKEVFAGNCLTFDLGYSGRIQDVLSGIVEKPLDVFFLHSSGMKARKIARERGFRIFEYLSYTPKITSIVREYFFSDLSPSCIGYRLEQNKLMPVFEEKEYNDAEHFIHSEMKRGMIDFVESYCKYFSQYEFMFDFRNEEISMPFEIFLNQTPEKDVYPFRICKTEDLFYFNYKSGSLSETWKYELSHQIATNFNGTQTMVYVPTEKIRESKEFLALSRFKRAIVLFFTDKKTFCSKLFRRKRKK